ncbi:MAG: TIGR03560 family F420-dependent LLM class oxidoreductase [Anaerolineales bacterium]|nr:TIGR03560 family F420-dependent LLM class oxidoreductase [Chloroflexota bacterium]MBL6983944.1 TIGR03560 family F420-dependent LLM class oxidoreductase [Anaerolineales bacterium]
MKIGLQLPHFRPSTAENMRGWMKDTIQTVDQGGFDSLFVMDHFFQLGGWLGQPEEEMIEGYTTLGFFAGLTEKVDIGLLVGGVIYRHPALVIKMMTTLDVLSGGRTYFGIGAAWYEKETLSLGMHFPTMKERFEQLEEILQIAKHMWSGDTSAYEGVHFNLPYPVNNPQPLRKPHPPIMIGGMGPKKTLRFVAKYGDACNFFGGAEDDVIKERLEILQGHCDDLGRPYEEVEKTVLQTADFQDGSVEDVISRGIYLQELGFTHLIFNVKGLYTPETLKAFTDVIIPALKS